MSNHEEQEDQLSLTQRTLLAAQDLRERLRAIERAKREPIAITGIGCRFPGGVTDRHTFWHLLRSGGDATGEMPAERWTVEDYYDPDPEMPGKMYTRRGAFLGDVAGFDAHFFGIAPREAIRMDPQQRLLLEVTWEALEDAGIPAEQLRGTLTGVFVGMMHNDYARLEQEQRDLSSIDAYTGTGHFFSVAAGRISYIFGLNGPSLTVDTACAASLVSVHLACQSLRAGECAVALAGGVNLLLRPEPFIESAKLHSLSPDGRCKTFDAAADGYVRGEGCGMIVLKRLSAAVRDHDPILAVIRASAVTHNGASGGLTVPNGQAQQIALRQSLNSAGIDPANVGYIEAHGTGTALGDPIEMQALGSVFGAGRQDENPLLVGSVKTNIGHLESAAGIAGLIKVVLALQHGEIPASLHLRQINPRIPLQALKLQIPTELHRWEASGRRIAGVNSAGVNGTNAHALLEEAPQSPVEISTLASDEAATGQRTVILPLSARSPQALRALAQSYLDRLANVSQATLQDICYSASLRRMHHEQRLALAGSSAQDLVRQLREFLDHQPESEWSRGQARPGRQERVVFVFPGQGAQWLGMGRLFIQQEPVFLETLRLCEQAVHAYTGWSVIEELQRSEEESRLAQIDVVQPVLFAIQVALAALWRFYGIEPDAVVGHSMGEVAAAYVAGVLDLSDAARIICTRSHMLKCLSGQGAMAVVALSLADTRELLSPYSDRLAVAASNSPYSTVISGDPAAIQAIQEDLKERNVLCTFVKVDVASHSPQVDMLRDELHHALLPVRPRPTARLMYSTVTGQPVQGAELDAEYWVRNLREPVLFGTTIQQLVTEGYHTCIELSPHPLLTVAVKEYFDLAQVKGQALPSMKRDQESLQVLFSSLGACYTRGLSLHWRGILRSERYTELPAYPWQRQRYWIDTAAKPVVTAPTTHANAAISQPGHPFPGTRIRTPLSHIQYEMLLDPARLAFLSDHRLSPGAFQGPIVVSGSAYLSMALSATREALHAQQCRLEQIRLIDALIIPEGESRILQLLLTPEGSGRYRMEIFSLRPEASGDGDGSNWTLHATGAVAVDMFASQVALVEAARAAILARCQREQNGEDFYEELGHVGYQFGIQYRWYERLWRGENEILAKLRPPQSEDHIEWYTLAPGLIDACIQAFCTGALDNQVQSTSPERTLYIPVGVERMTCDGGSALPLWVHGRWHADHVGQQSQRAALVGDVQLCDEHGRVVLACHNVRLNAVSLHALLPAPSPFPSNWLYELAWQERTLEREERNDFATAPRTARWLLLAHATGSGKALASEMARLGIHSHLLEIADFPHKSLDTPSWLSTLQALLDPSAEEWAGIVYICREEPSGEAAAKTQDIVAQQLQACSDVLLLVQTLAQRTSANPAPRIWLITRGTQALQQPVEITHATVWGLGSVIGLEHPESWGGLIDLEPAGSHGSQYATAQVVDELLTPHQVEQVAFRQRRRYVARLQSLASADPRLEQHNRYHLKEDATYLITGGLGGLGLLTARWMLERGARHLVLLGRSSPSESTLATVHALRDGGTEVLIAQGDVADETRMRELFASLSVSMPPLRGIIHAAGVLDDGILLHQRPQRFTGVFEPKVAGAWNMHRLSMSIPLDFFVLYSSAVSLIGSPGQGNYAAANAFLDMLAHHRRNQGLPALSINWGAWAGTGLISTHSIQQKNLFQGMNLISPQQGMLILEALLQQGRAQVGVLPIVWSTFSPYVTATRQSLFSSLQAEDGPTQPEEEYTLIQRMQDAPVQERQAMLTAALRSLILHVLGAQVDTTIDSQRPLRELGFDSLMSVELRNLLRAATGYPLPATLVYDYPTMTALIDHLLAMIAPQETPSATSPDAVEATYTQENLEVDIAQLSDEELNAMIGPFVDQQSS